MRKELGEENPGWKNLEEALAGFKNSALHPQTPVTVINVCEASFHAGGQAVLVLMQEKTKSLGKEIQDKGLEGEEAEELVNREMQKHVNSLWDTCAAYFEARADILKARESAPRIDLSSPLSAAIRRDLKKGGGQGRKP